MKLTVLVVDSDCANVGILAEALRESRQIETVLIATEPEGAMFQAKRADMIVLDPVLPGMDGAELLRRMIAQNLHPGVITLSASYSPDMLMELNELSVVRALIKPIDIGYLVRLIEKWYGGNRTRIGGNKLQLQRGISALLQELGMKPISGYYDCCAAIEWLCPRRQTHGKITKELYPLIARNSQQTYRQVERNIRYAIEQAWRNGDPEVLERYFGDKVERGRKRPTNAVFLRTLADVLRQTGMFMEEDETKPPQKASENAE